MNQSHEDALIEEIIGDAGKKAQRTQRRAEREARQAVEKAEKEADGIRTSVMQTAQQRAEREKEIVLATIDLDARRIKIEAEEHLITEAFDAAETRMMNKQGYDYAGTLVRLVAAACHAIGGDSFCVSMSEDDRAQIDFDALGRGVARQIGRNVQLELDNAPSPIKGGAIVHSEDGRRAVDNSFDGRLTRMREDLRRQAAEILFGEATT